MLSAGLGRRLRPTTEELPKCLLPVNVDRPVLELQLQALAQCGIRQVTIMVGYGAEKVERFLAVHAPTGIEVQTRYNPFFATTNTVVTCWLAIPEMTEDFVLVNGDTVFETEILRRVLTAPAAPLTLAIDQKAKYDEDDMKVALNGERRLKAVGKTLAASKVNGESLGLMTFRHQGVSAFRAALDLAIRDPAALQKWYHDIINLMADSLRVETVLIKGLWWREIDTPEDLAQARAYFVRM
ncbi:MAG: phosphocholine cytidylyltransferase family protein [Deltaproteobacteria bacterium]|nr:phosphocholine cytidylyltransferase family protein [Deltaproteobacteria bacterium]